MICRGFIRGCKCMRCRACWRDRPHRYGSDRNAPNCQIQQSTLTRHIMDAATHLLSKIENMTTKQFENGEDRAERETLRELLNQWSLSQ